MTSLGIVLAADIKDVVLALWLQMRFSDQLRLSIECVCLALLGH